MELMPVKLKAIPTTITTNPGIASQADGDFQTQATIFKSTESFLDTGEYVVCLSIIDRHV